MQSWRQGLDIWLALHAGTLYYKCTANFTMTAKVYMHVALGIRNSFI